MIKKKLFKLYLEEIKKLNNIESITERYDRLYPEDRIYDSQEYLNYHDSLNELSIDKDRIGGHS